MKAFKDFLKLMIIIACLVAVGCGILFFIVNQPPSRYVYEKADSGGCAKVLIGENEFPCSDFTSAELESSKIVFVDENYAHYEIVKMALNE